ncbi:MAG: EAL domain-containing protein, partial [Candidatus Izemoplasmatales bacterium]
AFMSQNESRTTYELLARAFDGLDFKVNSSCVMIIRLYNEKSKKVFGTSSKEKFNSYGFAEFLKEHLGPKFKISIPKETYTIIYTNLNKLELEFQELIDSIDSLIDKYKQLPNVNAALEYNFGVAKADNKSESKADLISNAFIALQMSKLQKNIKHLIYTEEVEKVIKKEKLIFDQLEYAFNNDEFYLQYQIQKDIKNSKYVGVEALLRWDSSILGNVSPVEFIKVIENSFFINRLSIMVLGKVINDFTPYIDLVNENFRISINLTYFDFFNDTIINSLVNLIEKSPFSPKNFCFEITESGYIENKYKTNEIIDYLHSKGIIVAIDDFGTGFSSLEVLKSLNVDKIKIDRSFIKDYPISDDGVMFKIIANLVKTLGFSSIVEGAETKEQIDLIIKNGIIEVQGYFVSKPLYIENLVKKYLNTKSDF